MDRRNHVSTVWTKKTVRGTGNKERRRRDIAREKENRELRERGSGRGRRRGGGKEERSK